MNFFQRLVLKQAFKATVKEAEMGGWKVKLASIAGFLSGGSLIAHAISTGDFDEAKQGVATLILALGAWGFGHKLDKNTAAVEATKAQ
jgi:hypothetical protein